MAASNTAGATPTTTAGMISYGWRDSWNDDRWDRSHTGCWPGDVAADTVGVAVGTAGTIATAPLPAGGAYAYDDGYDNRGYKNGWNMLVTLGALNHRHERK
jgi:hypothetical protein